MENNELKNIVQEKYAEIVTEKTSCCGTNPATDYSAFNLDYTRLDGYVEDADLNLGCGIPTEHANIKQGDTIVDLGSGAGNDVFVARSIIGDKGKVVGIDMTPEMIDKANSNKEKLGFENVEFKLGDIEHIPLDDEMCDVVVSNCVLNLVPDKEIAFNEIHRILKQGAHFCVSDIVLEGQIPPELKKSAEMYAGCVSGALQKNEYLDIIKKVGFINVEVKNSREIVLPQNLIQSFMDDAQFKIYDTSNMGIYSITVVATKK